MDRVIELTTVLRETVKGYVRPSPNATMYFAENVENEAFVAISIPHSRNPQSRVVVFGRIVDGKVVIETDITNKPLHEALMQAGIPRDQIVLAYQGETA
ncbi:MAG: element excision factor XisI family protein [Anaerolineae bacterium]|nr:XisI protein [Anaerolineae bacterium]